MSAMKHPGLNRLTLVDKFRVRAHNELMDRHYAFQVCGDRGTAPASFTCHIYDSPTLNYSGYVQADTVSLDQHQAVRCCASGRTLEELVHNLDWAHLPSELAQLKAMLSTRVTTDNGSLVGDLVALRMTPEQAKAWDEALARRAQEHAATQQEQLLQLAQHAITLAVSEVEAAGRFGLRKDVSLSFDTSLST